MKALNFCGVLHWALKIKKCLVLLLGIMSIANLAGAQPYAYMPSTFAIGFPGTMYYANLSNPVNTVGVGLTESNILAMDFDLSDNLYALSGLINSLYLLDMNSGMNSFIATVTPRGNEIWSGMACDPTTGVMYISSTNNVTSTFYTLDVSTGEKTMIGSSDVANGVVGIAFDDAGQMYAISMVSSMFYMINKTNGDATYVGALSAIPNEGPFHGLDFDPGSQTMYMTTFSYENYRNEIWTIDLATGSDQYIGSVFHSMGSLAVDLSISANFSADLTFLCEGNTVNYTDLSTGGILSWNWTFEGGTPSSSTLRNPTVTYNTSGVYDVKLVVSNGVKHDSMFRANYIAVESIPVQSSIPVGPSATCQSGSYEYTTTTILNADYYDWEVDPVSAGIISGKGTTSTFEASEDWTGEYTVKVRAANTCGTGPWSNPFTANLYHLPERYNVTGGGGFCEGTQGREIILEDSEIGIDYELFIDDVTTGIILPGSGSDISFGYQTETGFYTVVGFNDNCSELMLGENYIYTMYMPTQAGTPAGPESLCNSETATFTSSGSLYANNYIWTLIPEEAGTLVPDFTSAQVILAEEYTGTARISVHGVNSCGHGPESNDLEFMVLATPEPVISGLQLVYQNDVTPYSTPGNPSNNYFWEVSGGDIIAGTGTHEIMVLWGDPGTGFVKVTESNVACETTTDEYEVQIDAITSINEADANHLRVFPNPSANLVRIVSSRTIDHICLYTTTGSEIKYLNVNEKQVNLSISEYSSGIYVLLISTVDSVYHIKLFIQ